MKLTKRILCLLLAVALLFAVAACGKKNANPLEDERSNNLPIPSDTDSTTQGSGAATTTTTDDKVGNLEGDNQYNDGELEW